MRVRLSLRLLALAAAVPLLITACAAPAPEEPEPATEEPAEETAEPEPAEPVINDLVLTESADGYTLNGEATPGYVTVTIEDDDTVPGVPLLARLNDDVTLDAFMSELETGGPNAAAAMVSIEGSGLLMGESGPTPLPVIYGLEPGTYIAINIENEAPVLGTFEVAGDAPSGPAPEADLSVDLVDFAFAIPEEVASGQQTWRINNVGSQWHELVLLKQNEDLTIDQILEMIMQDEPPGGDNPPLEEVVFYGPISVGEQAWITVDLPAGDYVAVCFLPDLAGDGSPHAMKGMVRQFSVTD